jgi:hypothetical protein
MTGKGKLDEFKRIFERPIYFVRSTIGNVYPTNNVNDVERIDPILESKRINYWGKSVGAVFDKKFVSKSKLEILQKKVDALKIVKGFPEFCWKY